MKNSRSFKNVYLSVQVNESLGRLIVAWTVLNFMKYCHFILSLYSYCYCATTDASNDLINFPMCMGAKAYKETKTKGYNTFTLFVLLKVKIMNYLILIIITYHPHLLNFLLGTGNKVLMNVGFSYLDCRTSYSARCYHG